MSVVPIRTVWLLVATKNRKCAEEPGVFEFADAISPVCLFSCDRSFLGLYADSAVGRWWN